MIYSHKEPPCSLWAAPAMTSYWRQHQTGQTWAAVIRPDGGLLWGGLALFAVGWFSFAVCPSIVSKKSESFSPSSCWGCLVKTVAGSLLLLKKVNMSLIISPDLLEKKKVLWTLAKRKEKKLAPFLVCRFLLTHGCRCRATAASGSFIECVWLVQVSAEPSTGSWRLWAQGPKTELHTNTKKVFRETQKVVFKKMFFIHLETRQFLFFSADMSLFFAQETGNGLLLSSHSGPIWLIPEFPAKRLKGRASCPSEWLSVWLLPSFTSTAASTGGGHWKLPPRLIFREKVF